MEYNSYQVKQMRKNDCMRLILSLMTDLIIEHCFSENICRNVLVIHISTVMIKL